MDETSDTPDCKSRLVLNLSQANRIECAVRAVIKLYCTDVSCEWVSCLQVVTRHKIHKMTMEQALGF